MANEKWSYVEKYMHKYGSGIYFLIRIAEKGEYEIWRMRWGGEGRTIVIEDDVNISITKRVPWEQIVTIQHIDIKRLAEIASGLLKINQEMIRKTAVFCGRSQAKIDFLLTSL